ncbi:MULTISPECIES: hypothetical protein [Pseudomonadota]|jgi:ABC-type glycerol-3-phosphate transport system substrate-binding protein|uniref:hypothetical protein n=1 Tax=Pseudomonadota TaxID=1224 RepID=UPI000825E45E|nr:MULTISPECIES: hypothetical protein [Pseudomonadota]|tara:strand:+ start:86365 stop:86853 length:489 start_codon:yes stop_codon:yes gene_type:complete
MRNSLMAVAAVVLLAGCGGEKTVYSDAEGNEVKVTREGDGDASEVKITSADGSATVNINAGATDAKLPFGLEVYPGAKVVSTMNSNSDGNTGAMVVMESSARPDAVLAWYRKSVEAKGFKVETEITTGDMRAIAGTKDGGSFTLQVAPADAGSSITLIAGAS